MFLLAVGAFGVIWFYFSMLLLGLSMAAPPGPVNAMITFASLDSKINGTAIGAGAMTADLIFFFAASLISKFIPTDFIKILYALGGSCTILLGVLVFRSKNRFKVKAKGSYLVGLSMGLTNPYQIAWWASFGIAMLERFGISSGIGFFSGIVLWIFFYPYFIEKTGRASKKVEGLIKIASAIVLMGAGLYMLLLFFIGFICR